MSQPLYLGTQGKGEGEGEGEREGKRERERERERENVLVCSYQLPTFGIILLCDFLSLLTDAASCCVE
jgi:hypothetical protein